MYPQEPGLQVSIQTTGCLREILGEIHGLCWEGPGSGGNSCSYEYGWPQRWLRCFHSETETNPNKGSEPQTKHTHTHTHANSCFSHFRGWHQKPPTLCGLPTKHVFPKNTDLSSGIPGSEALKDSMTYAPPKALPSSIFSVGLVEIIIGSCKLLWAPLCDMASDKGSLHPPTFAMVMGGTVCGAIRPQPKCIPRSACVARMLNGWNTVPSNITYCGHTHTQ